MVHRQGHSTRPTKLTAGYILDPDATREKIKVALRASANVEAAATLLGVSERHLYIVIGKDDALRAWWKAEQEERRNGLVPTMKGDER